MPKIIETSIAGTYGDTESFVTLYVHILAFEIVFGWLKMAFVIMYSHMLKDISQETFTLFLLCLL